MANEDDNVKSSSFAISIIHTSYSGIKRRYAFSQKRICVQQNQLLYLLRFRNKEFVMVAGSSS